MTRRGFLVASAALAPLAAACGRGPAPAPSTGASSPAVPSGVAQVLLLDGVGPGGFAAYVEELLAADGVLGVRTAPASSAAPAALEDVSAVVLYGGPISAAWVEALVSFVQRGGALVALTPDPVLLARLGIADRGPLAAAAGSVAFADAAEDGALRLHVPGRAWDAGAAAVEATFAAAVEGPATPAVVRIRVGDGAASCWAFDVARNISLIRQGNPEWANTERDDLPGIRLIDALHGWLRPETLDRPDADLYQRRLTAALMGHDTRRSGPRLCLDYFPGDARSVLVATADAHGNGAGALDALLRRVEAAGGRLSVYYTPPATTGWRLTARRARWALGRLPAVGDAFLSDLGPPAPYVVDAWRARGHEFAPHPAVDEGFDLHGGLAAAWQAFDDDGYGRAHLSTRTHKILWTGWVETARAQRDLGVRMNLDAYHLGPSLRRADGRWAHGHVIGSGLPLRFVDPQGQVIDCYQQPTQIVDEHLVAVFRGLEGLSAEDAVAVVDGIVADAVTRAPAALCGQFHADGFVGAPERVRAAEILLDGTLAACQRHGVPVVTAAHWLAFLDARRASSLESRAWDAESQTLSCALRIGDGTGAGVGVLLPAEVDGAPLGTVTVNGAGVAPATATRGGRRWARVTVRPGAVQLVAHYQRG